MHQSNLQGKLPPEVYRPFTKQKFRTQRLTLLALALSSLVGQASACDYGFYISGSTCVVCPAGSYCSNGSTKSSCSSGQWSPQGAKACKSCPAGFYCSTTSAFPISCDVASNEYSTGSATSCSSIGVGYYTTTPNTAPSTCAAPAYLYQSCNGCPAGSFCASGVANNCAVAGNRNFFGNTYTSCTQVQASYFGKDGYFDQTECPDNTYSVAGAGYCNYVSAGYKINAAQTGQTACTGTTTQSAFGAAACSNAPEGYYIGAGQTAGTISMKAIPQGYYKASVTSQDAVQCEYGYSCTTTAHTACDAMKYSILGWSDCFRVPIGYYASGSALTACPDTAYNKVTSTCGTCSYAKCDQFTGLTQTCQVGYYFASASTQACTVCPVGKYCADGMVASTATKYYPTINTQEIFGEVACPAGYTCTKTTMTVNDAGEYSDYAQADPTEYDYVISKDLKDANAGGDCPAQSYRSDIRLSCTPTSFQNKPTNDGTGDPTSQEDCGAAEIAWIMDPCVTLTQNSDYHFESDETKVYSGVHCPTGWDAFYQEAPGSEDYACIEQTAYSYIAMDFVKGVSKSCPAGDFVLSNQGGSNTVAYQHNMQETNDARQCQDCPVNSMCYTSDTNAFTQFCVGKSPSIDWYDLNNSNLLIQMDDRRVSIYQNQYCFDCNAEMFSSGICTFGSDYFPDHERQTTAGGFDSNQFVVNMILKCPFQSATRTQQRYLDTVQWDRLDATIWTKFDMQSSTYTYNTYAFFDDTEDNIYPYSFCDIDEEYFTSEQISSHSEFVDSTETVATECTLYEYFDPNFPMCVPIAQGFIHGTYIDDPTEYAVQDGYITQITQNDAYTGIKLMQCPEFTEWIMEEGGAGIYHACHIKDIGSCKDSTSDYCNNGQDYMCPTGFTIKASAVSSPTNTINDCESCGAGQVCSDSTTDTTCPVGYNCEAMTDDVYSKPGQPGELLVANAATFNNDITDCTGGYCEGATSSITLETCPVGYNLDYTGASTDGQHSKAGCYPVLAGTYGVSATTCDAGKICPSGSQAADIFIPPGFFSASTGLTALRDSNISPCTAGSFCAEGSTTDATSCEAGYYCEEGTVFQYDFTCPFGSTTVSGSSAYSECLPCTSGDFCRQGQVALTGDYCGNDNFLCMAGDLKRTECADGEETTDGATCSACPAGKFCTAGVPAVNCEPGYESNLGGLSTCDLSSAGQVTSGSPQITADASDGAWTIEGQTVEFTCPAGYHCAGGIIIGCEVGEICPEGSLAASAATAGTVGDEVNLFYDKPCPAGYVCEDSVARAEVTVGQYTLQGDDGATALFCNSGYSCDVGSIGPNQKVCEEGTYYVTGTASADCPICADGSYCYQAQEIACEPGMYCDQTGSPETHQQCPLGTYSLAGSNAVECTECDGGYACIQRGLTTTPSYLCGQGYFCVTGSTSTQPERIVGVTASPDDTYQCDPTLYDLLGTGDLASLAMSNGLVCNQGICPRGYYCPEGTTLPVICPAGTYNLNYGEVSVAGCVSCIDGYYCPTTLERVECDQGTVCPTGQDNQDSVTNVLIAKPAVGYYSLDKYPDQIPCPAGKFQVDTGSYDCDSCTAGSQCPITGMSVVDSCDLGADCSRVGTKVPQLCQYGKYLDPSNLVNPGCVDCPEDNFCWDDGIIEADVTLDNIMRLGYKTSGLCPSGYKCVSGADIRGQNQDYATSPTAYLCRTGYYCDNTNIGDVEQTCATGTYMPRIGAETDTDCLLCKPGYECASAGTSVPSDCPSGFFCFEGTVSTIDQCQAGTYCPTNAEQQFACAYGSYTSTLGQTTCATAQTGTYIDTTSAIVEIDCPIGYYCEAGSVTPTPCPAGTTSALNTAAQGDCTDVALGQYRSGPTVNGVVADGYSAPVVGEYYEIPTRNGAPCEAGSFCVGGIQTVCVAGTRCENEMATANVVVGKDECDAGYYCHAGTNRRRPTSLTNHFGDICTQAHYCEISSPTPTACPIGYYSDAFGLQAEAQCQFCKNGYYCPTAALMYDEMILCPAGKYCEAQTTTSAGTGTCDYGKYCPIGSLEQLPCAPGNYMDTQGASFCFTCPVGSYCSFEYDIGVLTSQKFDCPVGYMCPDTDMHAPTPCSIGYYQSSIGQTTCIACVAGYYCPEQATEDYLTYPCPNQFYCIAGSSKPVLCIDGQHCETSSPSSQTVDTLCPVGYYCIAGIQYVCYSGYLCIEGATTPYPTDGSTGSLCDQGYYCVEGATSMTPCGIGNYQAFFGATSTNNCIVCPAGTSCPLAANVVYTTVTCTAGYICDQNVETPCDAGMYCPQSTLVMLKCPAQYYQALTAQTTCDTCPEKFYCPSDVLVGTITPIDCPDGHYCPEGTGNFDIYRCGTGTYHLTSDGPLGASTSCTPCEETYYCPQVAMTEVEYLLFPCQDGYLCGAGSESGTGTAECPKDFYCVAGTAISCPAGYYSTETGLRAEDECVACPPGKICPNFSAGIYSCVEGYFCPGLITAEADMTICPVGHYCPSGSALALMCEPGNYQDVTGQSDCVTCTQGNYCPTSGLSAPTPCVTDYEMFYCPTGSIFPRKCSIGYYIEDDQFTCTECPAGKYCWPAPDNSNDGQEGDCDFDEGYLCRKGAFSPRPLIVGLLYIQPGSNYFLSYNGPVMGGYTAQAGGVAEACLPGFFQPSIMSSECLDCYQGRYCPNSGMSDLAEYRCAAGSYCLVGSWLEEPKLADLYRGTNVDYAGASVGGICEVTFECSYALIHKMLCEDGYISQEEGLSQCGACPSGFYCDIEENEADPIPCISQSVCTSAEKRQPICPAGTFMNEGDQYCQMCTAGHYCVAGIIAEECAAGYLCDEPAFNISPDPAGTECEVGFYCPKGETTAIPCPFETMSVTAVAKQVTDCASCQPGYLCPYGSREATECPAGYYCPPQADDIVYKGEQYECALGTYNPWTKKIYQVDCLDCDDGYYCNETAIANISSRECPRGHYCPLGTVQPRPCPAGTYQSSLGAFDEDTCEGCPLGKYCPEASEEDIQCEDGYFCPFRSATMLTCTGGFYCNEETRYQEQECPVNSYCPRGTGFPIACDDKHICPARTEEQIFCENGYFVDTKPSSYGGQNLCRMCPIGTYSIADTVGCAPCPPGYLCYGGTNTNVPISDLYNRGEICPKGAYCPEGSYEPEYCPPGTYNQDVGAGSLEECALCPAGAANALYGAEGCRPCGQFASSNEGALQCTCTGDNRVYSPVDNSCRCRSGFDFQNEQSISEGQSSDITDCIPLVFDRCDAEGEVRDPTGRCTQKNSCAAECFGGSGTRDDILGVCSCVGQKTTDQLCNQECRSSAPKMAMNSTTTLTMIIDGKARNVDLTESADVFGKATGTGKVVPVTLGTTGYVGSYQAPPLLAQAASLTAESEALQAEIALNATKKANQAARRAAASTSTTKKRRLEDASYDRKLQAISTVTDEIPNPIYCISEQDTFLFQIPEPTHYPVYMKDSVMNNNLGFDYGSFIDLSVEMKRKQAQGLTTASMFAFTFTESGNYVFQDGDDQSQILVITVKGLGEKCSDPDRYLQIQSGKSLAENGVSQRTDLIIQPNYPLIISMTFLLFFGTGFAMWMVSYCMKKGWTIKDIPRDNYRETQLSINIHHENEKVFIDNNDFVQHKSELIDHDEDELDSCNLDIQQDLVDAGKKYLHKYEKRKQKHKRAKLQKKKQIEELMAEVESLVHILNSDSTAAQMHWLDLEVLQDGAQIDDKTIKFQIEKQMEAINRQEEKQNENYKAKKEELLANASERERLLYEKARQKMLLVQTEMNKHFNQGDDVQDAKQASEFAIYDNGDIRSKNNQLVKKIEQNENLNDEEKERLLQTHEKNLHNIDNLLEVEKRKQEQELDRALKERLDRRHRLKEKQHGSHIRQEQASVEKDAVEEFDQKKKSTLDEISKQHESLVKEILTNSDLILQRQQINDLEELTEQKKRQAASDLENEQNKEIEVRKAQISKKFMNGAENEEELANELQKLMGDQASATSNLMNQAALEKSSQEAKLNERLTKRQQKIHQQMKEETEKVIALVEKEDLIHLHERETVATEAHLRLKAKALLQDGNDGTLPTGCLGLDRQGLPITDAKQVQASDVARKEAEERKEAVKETMFKLDQEIDTSLQQKSLLADLESQDASLALMLKQQDDKQAAKLNARRAQLKARRLAKVKNEQQEKQVRAEIDVEEEKQEEQQKITEKYVRTLFKQVPKNETPQQRDKRLEILNEYLSDQFLEELSGMLTKQYIETDALLKMTMRKYLEEGISEATAIKEHFKIDNESLQMLKPHMKDEMYHEQLKKLKLNEENLLKRTDLTIQKAHADEEARIRKELDKKHMQEQIELRVNVSQRQASMRMELVGESLMGDAEFEHDRKALERFQLLKSTEQERRIRAIELQKKTLTNQVESEMKQNYDNFDEMMRKKKQAQLEQADQQDSLRSRIQERMNRLKKNAVQQGMTQEEQDAMLKNYQEQLSQLDSAYAAEQRRQQLIMKTKQENRKKRLIKVQQLKQELDKQSEAPQTTAKLTNSFSQALRRQMFKNQERMDDDSELLQRLKDWDTHKRDYEFLTFAKKAQEAGTVELDENQIKIMILKLQQIEKLLKEVGKKKKLRNNEAPQVKGRRRTSAASTVQQFQSSYKSTMQGKNNLQGIIVQETDMNSDDSEGAMIKRQDSKNLTARKPTSGLNNSRLGNRKF